LLSPAKVESSYGMNRKQFIFCRKPRMLSSTDNTVQAFKFRLQ